MKTLFVAIAMLLGAELAQAKILTFVNQETGHGFQILENGEHRELRRFTDHSGKATWIQIKQLKGNNVSKWGDITAPAEAPFHFRKYRQIEALKFTSNVETGYFMRQHEGDPEAIFYSSVLEILPETNKAIETSQFLNDWGSGPDLSFEQFLKITPKKIEIFEQL